MNIRIKASEQTTIDGMSVEYINGAVIVGGKFAIDGAETNTDKTE